MGKSCDWDWEDEISTGFEQLVVQDKETGECWPVPKEKETFTAFDAVKSMCTRRPPGMGCWKVPKEYSMLGCGSPSKVETIQPVYTGADSEVQGAQEMNWTCEEGESSDQTAIIATFPPAGRLPALCRKRRCSGGASAAKTVPTPESTKNSQGNCGVETFLEGRERLLFVGRLLFAFLVLLSPGYFFPLLFFIRTYCHYWKHSAADQEEEIIVSPNSGVFGFLHTKTFLKYSCRLCREQLKTEKMFRIHSKIGPGSLQKSTSAAAEPVLHECPHNHFF